MSFPPTWAAWTPSRRSRVRLRPRSRRRRAKTAVVNLGGQDQLVRVVKHLADELHDVGLVVADLEKIVVHYKTCARARALGKGRELQATLRSLGSFGSAPKKIEPRVASFFPLTFFACARTQGRKTESSRASRIKRILITRRARTPDFFLHIFEIEVAVLRMWRKRRPPYRRRRSTTPGRGARVRRRGTRGTRGTCPLPG